MATRNYKYGRSSIKCILSVHASLQRVANEAQRIANDANDTIDIPDWGYSHGLRTLEEQVKLYSQGRTTEGPIVTMADGVRRKSNHQYGHALDFFGYVDGRASYEPHHVHTIAALHLQAAMNVGVTVRWGGLFTTFYDGPHIELIGVPRNG